MEFSKYSPKSKLKLIQNLTKLINDGGEKYSKNSAPNRFGVRIAFHFIYLGIIMVLNIRKQRKIKTHDKWFWPWLKKVLTAVLQKHFFFGGSW